MLSRFGSTFWIIACTIAVAVVPLFAGGMRHERARWHLAAAANAIELGQSDGDQQLERAMALVPDIEQMHGFWLLQIKLAIRTANYASIEEVLQLAKKHDPDFSSTVGYAIDTLTRNQEFAHAVAIFELIENEAMRTDPIYLNQISYFRALAGIELDEALENINEALRLYPENEAFRDTRAWVLFQMGRPLEALEDADFAVARMTKPQTGFWAITGELYDYFDQWFPKQDVSVQSEKPLTQREAPIELWTEGALRYHRACILESLLRTDEAQEEWDWLEANRLPTDGTLY